MNERQRDPRIGTFVYAWKLTPGDLANFRHGTVLIIGTERSFGLRSHTTITYVAADGKIVSITEGSLTTFTIIRSNLCNGIHGQLYQYFKDQSG
jgi:hypothetical protein